MGNVQKVNNCTSDFLNKVEIAFCRNTLSNHVIIEQFIPQQINVSSVSTLEAENQSVYLFICYFI
jgi:hypothetical protein